MWEYTDKVKDHFLNPRNVGVIEDADGVGEVGSIACGDALTFYFKLGEGGRINICSASRSSGRIDRAFFASTNPEAASPVKNSARANPACAATIIGLASIRSR